MGTYLKSAESFFLQPIEGRPIPPKSWEHTHEDMPVSGEPPFVLWAVLFVVGLIAFFALQAKKISAPTPPISVVCSFPPAALGHRWLRNRQCLPQSSHRFRRGGTFTTSCGP